MNSRFLSSVLIILFYFFIHSCKQDNSSIINTSEFILEEGFNIELIAAEPLLDSPVAMQFDKKGRIWVVELPGYMRDINGSGEDLPDGKIVVLSDEDEDGKMDNRFIFLDKLIAPRTLLFAYNGLLYSEGTNLWWTSIENDRPGNQVLIDSLYVIGGNIEHQPNALLYNLDNWIYSAKSNARYKMKDGIWFKEATTARGQWGLTNDDFGKLFYNDNSNPLTGDYMMPNVLTQHPNQKVEYGHRQQIAINRRVFPYQATAVNRGYEEGVLDENNMLINFTSACGPLIYRGNQLPNEYYGNAFVCGPEVNLIKRFLLKNDNIKITALQAYEEKEFLISKDETFRPINLYTGLNGALYILDLRKGVIQHRAYMTSYLREKILEKKLEKANGKGRIYKVMFKGIENEKTIDCSKYEPIDFVPLLKHKNGELRILAQKEIVFSKDISLMQNLIGLALDTNNPIGQIHALRTMEGLDILNIESLKKVAQGTQNQRVITQCILLANDYVNEFENILPIINKAITFESPSIDLHLCHILGKTSSPESNNAWSILANKYSNGPIFCEALISGINGKEDYYYKNIKYLKSDSIYNMLSQTIASKKNNEIKAPQLLTKTFLDNRTKGFQLYNTYCSSCHGQDGKGNPQLAPPLYPSEYVTGPPEKMIAIMLQGLKGPVQVNGLKYDMNLVMPGIKNNPELTDEKIADLVIFIKNSFTQNPTYIDPKLVGKIRARLEGSDKMFTEESLMEWLDEHNLSVDNY